MTWFPTVPVHPQDREEHVTLAIVKLQNCRTNTHTIDTEISPQREHKVELISNTLLLKQQYKRQFACYKGHPIPPYVPYCQVFQKSASSCESSYLCSIQLCFLCCIFYSICHPLQIPLTKACLLEKLSSTLPTVYPSLWNIYPFSLSWQIFKSQNLLPDCQFYLELS